jgi:hypothetical protein
MRQGHDYDFVMASFKDALTPELINFIRRQPIYFTASAAEGTRINLSPKGIDTFRVLDEKTVGYLDLTGSGNETAAHLIHDGRLTIMFCSFDEKPLILRLYGRGRFVRPDDPQWPSLLMTFPNLPGARQIILLSIESLQTSCGFAVPRMELIEPRPTLIEWAEKKGTDAIEAYQQKNNRKSIDGLTTSVK